jgi:hypothetical protein
MYPIPPIGLNPSDCIKWQFEPYDQPLKNILGNLIFPDFIQDSFGLI